MYIGSSANPERVQYDEMLSLLRKLLEEQKAILQIYANRQVYHEQIIKVLDIGIKAGIDKVGYPAGSSGGGWPFVHVQRRQ